MILIYIFHKDFSHVYRRFMNDFDRLVIDQQYVHQIQY